MQRNLFSLLFTFFVLGNLIRGESDKSNGLEIEELKLSFGPAYVKDIVNIVKPYQGKTVVQKRGDWVWNGQLSYKFQKESEIYRYLSINYLEGRIKHIDEFQTMLSKARLLHFKGALGYSFLWNDSNMISPFLALGWRSYTRYNDRGRELGDQRIFNRIKGTYAMLGMDWKWKLTENLLIGLNVGAGIIIGNKVKDADFLPLGSERPLKNKLCYEIILPFNYYYKSWSFGLELSQSYWPRSYTREVGPEEINYYKAKLRTFNTLLSIGKQF